MRNTIDIEFGSINDHKFNPYIPKGEIWIDKAFKKEKDVLLRNDFLIRQLMKKNKNQYEKAKAELRKMVLKKTKNKADIIKTTKIELIKNINGVAIWLIDGLKTRLNLDPYFRFGGHGYVYKYIPKNEIWIDDKVVPDERKYIIVHEFYERQLMRGGKDYNSAHDYANADEKEARRKDGVAHYLTD